MTPAARDTGARVKVLLLYTELADYTLACLTRLARVPETEVHVVHWPVNDDAPFRFAYPEEISFYERDALSDADLRGLARRIDPDLVLCSGWMDRGYLSVCRSLPRRPPRVLLADNPWNGSLRQRLTCLIGPPLLRRHFTHAWVPGAPQAPYAERLGFAGARLRRGFYAADVDRFHALYLAHRAEKQRSFPKRFLFVGRYHPVKGIEELWEAFLGLEGPEAEAWELHCAGTGPLAEQAPRHPRIHHFGFVQPDQLAERIRTAGIYVMPSRHEPWGVSLHAFAASGFPLLCSEVVGSASAFLEEGVNGWSHRAGDVSALREAMQQTIRLAPEQLLEMGRRSTEKARTITPGRWVATLLELASGVTRPDSDPRGPAE